MLQRKIKVVFRLVVVIGAGFADFRPKRKGMNRRDWISGFLLSGMCLMPQTLIPLFAAWKWCSIFPE